MTILIRLRKDRKDFMGHKVLLVDDDPHVLGGLRRALHKEPYEILTASSGREGLEILGTTSIDLIVTDQEMPGSSGTEFLHQVREAFPGIVRFLLTGSAILEVVMEAVDRGDVSRFFTKPCNKLELAISIRQALQQKDLETEACRLLEAAKQASALLDRLEEEYPGIDEKRRDHRKAATTEKSPYEPSELIDRIRSELKKM